MIQSDEPLNTNKRNKKTFIKSLLHPHSDTTFIWMNKQFKLPLKMFGN